MWLLNAPSFQVAALQGIVFTFLIFTLYFISNNISAIKSYRDIIARYHEQIDNRWLGSYGRAFFVRLPCPPKRAKMKPQMPELKQFRPILRINLTRAHSYMDKRIFLQLNGKRKITGVLRGFDPFMNIVVDDGVDETDAAAKTPIGTVVRFDAHATTRLTVQMVRGNSIVMLEVLEKL
jgi:small nuclear ribonucleoprotein G